MQTQEQLALQACLALAEKWNQTASNRASEGDEVEGVTDDMTAEVARQIGKHEGHWVGYSNALSYCHKELTELINLLTVKG